MFSREDLPKLEYLTMCIKEGMRCHSPVPAVGRLTTKEMTIDGTTYPPGTSVGVSINLLHTNPTVWKDPHTFDPQRFSKDNITKIQPYSYCPFAAGSRYHFYIGPCDYTNSILFYIPIAFIYLMGIKLPTGLY